MPDYDGAQLGREGLRQAAGYPGEGKGMQNTVAAPMGELERAHCRLVSLRSGLQDLADQLTAEANRIGASHLPQSDKAHPGNGPSNEGFVPIMHCELDTISCIYEQLNYTLDRLRTL